MDIIILHVCASKRNDAFAFERKIFSKNQDYTSLLWVVLSPVVPIFFDLHTRGGRKLQTDTQARHDYRNPRCFSPGVKSITKDTIVLSVRFAAN